MVSAQIFKGDEIIMKSQAEINLEINEVINLIRNLRRENIVKVRNYFGKTINHGNGNCKSESEHKWDKCADWAICRNCFEVRKNLNFFSYGWRGVTEDES